MSAICGIYTNTKINSIDIDNMMKQLSIVKHDRTNTSTKDGFFTGCFMQMTTLESLNELLPYESEEDKLILNASAILYNREELFELLLISKDHQNITDSQLILYAYKKWKDRCVNYLVGSFVFVIMDYAKNEIFVARDHTGQKVLYYYHTKGFFAFSSLIEPLFTLDNVKRRLNEEYIADFLSINSVRNTLDASITIYQDILQVPPAHVMTIKEDGIKLREYWKVKKSKKIRMKKDEEYEESFRDIYTKSVKERLRTNNNIGIALSGGLDSTSVACIAANELKKNNKMLYSYTQVPMKEYVNNLSATKIADESEFVEETSRYTGNILPEYIDSKGKNMYNIIDEMLDIIEQPYKFLGNSTWLNELIRVASIRDCKMLLTGQVGNMTVSWGKHSCYMQELLKSFRFLEFIKETRIYSKKHKRNSIKYALSQIVSIVYPLDKFVRLLKRNKLVILLSPVNPSYYKDKRMKQRFKKFGFDNQFTRKYNSFMLRYQLLCPSACSQYASVYDKISMYYGIEISDPTGDKRLIDFCINLPENQWAREGIERRLIRVALKGIIPDSIRLNDSVRGKQGADSMQRIISEWNDIRREMLTIGEHPLEQKYLNIPLIKQLLSKNLELTYESSQNDCFRLLFRALVFARFIRRIENKLE